MTDDPTCVMLTAFWQLVVVIRLVESGVKFPSKDCLTRYRPSCQDVLPRAKHGSDEILYLQLCIGFGSLNKLIYL